MEIILVGLIGVIIAFVLASRALVPPERNASAHPEMPPLSSSEPAARRGPLPPSRPLRADAAEVLPIVFDAQEQVVGQTRQLASALVAKMEKGSNEEAYLKGIQEELETHLEAIETNRHSLQSTIDSMPEDHILLIPDFDKFMGSMLDQWLDAMYDQWPVVSLTVDHNETLTPGEREAEKARLALDAITAAIELLDQVKMAGAVSAENTRECIAAFMVDLMWADGHICANKLTFLNRVFSRDWDAGRYLARYAEKLKDNKAASDLVTLMEELGGYNMNMSLFLNRALQPLVSHAIEPAGGANEREFGKLATFNTLLEQRLGATDSLPQALESA